jgi:hypothetical protein
LDSLERAIRTAFEKGNPADGEFRKGVYRSALAALERALAKKPETRPGEHDGSRNRLRNIIRLIETEFRPATAPQVEAPEERKVAPAPAERPTGRIEPVMAARGARPEVEPRRPVRSILVDTHDRPKRGLFLPFVIGSVILLGLGAYMFSMSVPSVPRAPSARTPPLTASDDPAKPDDADWLEVFSSSDLTSVVSEPGTRVEQTTVLQRRFLRISPGPNRKAEVRFDIPEGVLAQLAGSPAIFALQANSSDGAVTMLAVTCSPGTGLDCGRKRYEIGSAPEDVILELAIPSPAPAAGAALIVSMEMETPEAYLDVQTLRVRKSEASQ